MNAIVKAHGAGLFSNINKVLVALRIYDHVEVDWSVCDPNDPGYAFGNGFYGDCWRDLFNYSARVPRDQSYEVVHLYPFWDITGGCAGVLYQNPQWGWREAYHKAWLRLDCRLHRVAPPKSLGVLIRADNLAGEQLSGKSQSYEEYFAAIERETYDYLFVCASDEESLQVIMKRYPTNSGYYPCRRATNRGSTEQHIASAQVTQDAIDTVHQVLMLASCDALIHPVSNMATAALYINPNLRSIYLK